MRAILACVSSACGIAACAVDGVHYGQPDPIFSPKDASSSEARVGVDGGASLTDGAVPVEAGTDAATPPPDASVTFCQGQTTNFLCSDFESGVIPTPWTRLLANGGGTVKLQQEDGSTVLAAALATSTGSNGCLRRSFGSGKSSFTIELRARVARAGTGNYDIFQLTNAGLEEIGLELTPSRTLQFDYEENGADKGGSTNKTFPSTWARVRLQATKSGSSIAVRALVNDELWVDNTTTAKALDGDPTIELGDCSAGDAANWELHYDDVVIR